MYFVRIRFAAWLPPFFMSQHREVMQERHEQACYTSILFFGALQTSWWSDKCPCLHTLSYLLVQVLGWYVSASECVGADGLCGVGERASLAWEQSSTVGVDGSGLGPRNCVHLRGFKIR